MTELKPCPFCGGKAVLCENTDYAYVYCKECGSQTDESHGTAGAAVAAWNTRAERTCKMTKLEPPLLLEGWWSCSECGPVFPPCNDEIAVWVLQQCPHCGAKVVV